MAKGASIYLMIEFSENEELIIRFIAGGYDIFHVMKNDADYWSNWYQLNSKYKKEWNDLFNKLLHQKE